MVGSYEGFVSRFGVTTSSHHYTGDIMSLNSRIKVLNKEDVIDPEPIPLQESDFPVSSEDMYDEPSPISHRQKRTDAHTEKEAMKKAKTAYDTAYGNDTYLYVKTGGGTWRKVAQFTSQQMYELGYDVQRQAEELLKNPLYTDYHFTTDKYFIHRKNIERQKQLQQKKTVSDVKQNIQSAFKYQSYDVKKQALEDKKAYGVGPSISALFQTSPLIKKRPASPSGQRQSIPSPMGEQGEDYISSPYQPVESEPLYSLQQRTKPLGYQEESVFGRMVVPYRPTKAAFVKGAQRKPLFRPPSITRTTFQPHFVKVI
jgi:hypothetical protein